MLAATVLFSALVSGCATEPAAPMSNAELCTTIKTIIGQASDDFKDIRLRKVIHPEVDIWESKKIFPDSKQCQIWSWSQGLTNYACMWQESDEAEARSTYDKYRPVVAACLGEAWEATEQPAKNGRQTIFRKAGDKTTVSMRFFQDRRALIHSWWTSFIVGPEIKTYDPLQRYDAE